MKKIHIGILVALLITLLSACSTMPPINKAIMKEDTEKSLAYIDSGKDIHEADGLGRSPVHWAAVKGNTEVLSALLKKGANAESPDSFLISRPVHYASMNDNPDLIKLLLEKGANVDAVDRNGVTALKTSILKGHKGMVNALINAGADVNKMTGTSSTALLAAVYAEYPDIVKLLLESGAHVDGSDQNGNTPLIVSASKGNSGIFELLLDNGADISISNDQGQSPLIAGAFNGNMEVVDLALDHGGDINAQTKYGRNSLHLAAVMENNDVAERLIEKGATPAVIETSPEDLFGTANSNGIYAAVMLRKGEDVDIEEHLNIAVVFFEKAESEYQIVVEDIDHNIASNALKTFGSMLLAATLAQAQANVNAQTSGTGYGYGSAPYTIYGSGNLKELKVIVNEKIDRCVQLREKYQTMMDCLASSDENSRNNCINSED